MLQALLADTYPSFWLPGAASKNAGEYDVLFNVIMAINIIFSSLIMAILIYFVLKYRHRKGVKNNPTAGHSTALELTWTIIPTLIVIAIFYYGFRGYLRANVMPPEAYEITANGQMWNWSFTYPNGHTDPELHLVYGRIDPKTRQLIRESVPTRMILQSADVIHDLAIPSFRMKKDDVPGRSNREYFEPDVTTAVAEPSITYDFASHVIPPAKTVETVGDYGLYTKTGAAPRVSAHLEPGDTYGFQMLDGKPVAVYTQAGQPKTVPIDPKLSPQYIWKLPYGYFQIYCAMYCGQNHSTMLAKCVVQTPDEFKAWLDDVSTWEDKLSYIDRGRELYNRAGCSQCHTLTGAASTGPTWKDLYGSHVEFEGGLPSIEHVDDAYIKESIIDPGAKIVKGFKNVMPSNFRGQLTDHDIMALTWFMKSISENYKGDLSAAQKIGAPEGETPPQTQPAGKPGPAPDVSRPSQK